MIGTLIITTGCGECPFAPKGHKNVRCCHPRTKVKESIDPYLYDDDAYPLECPMVLLPGAEIDPMQFLGIDPVQFLGYVSAFLALMNNWAKNELFDNL